MPRTGRGRTAHTTAAGALALVVACRDAQDTLVPAGPQAGHIASLTMMLVAVGGVTYVLVLAALAGAAWRARRRERTRAPADESPATERRLGRVVGTATGISTLVVLGYVVASAATGRAIAWPQPLARVPLTIEATGHQWWWEFRYVDTVPSRSLTTANELHLPAGRPVRLVLRAADVIHSFWVPNLHGKQDMIPGYENVMLLRADRQGRYRGQCGEYCGQQHAHMAFDVVVESPARFAAWYERQLSPAPEPSDSSARRGRDVLLAGGCVMCHTIGGTPAGSVVGPDLTHVASRSSLAAGTIPNTRGNLAGWIVDPQRIKPGVRMPPNQLSADDLSAILDYLRSLR